VGGGKGVGTSRSQGFAEAHRFASYQVKVCSQYFTEKPATTSTQTSRIIADHALPFSSCSLTFACSALELESTFYAVMDAEMAPKGWCTPPTCSAAGAALIIVACSVV